MLIEEVSQIWRFSRVAQEAAEGHAREGSSLADATIAAMHSSAWPMLASAAWNRAENAHMVSQILPVNP
ncbi:MAG: hypothetical protein JNN03_12180 [Rubrivivax sp.]|nr:hypothetical protein [Rubrivivax sp.]